MRYTIYFMLIVLLSACRADWRHSDSNAYMRLPNLELLLSDSVHFHTSQLPVDRPDILFYFQPDCEHCQAMTDYLLANRKSLGDADILFISPAPWQEIQQYARRFHLDGFSNILVSRDYKYEVFNKYKIEQFPDIIIYNRHQELTKLYKSEVELFRIIRALHS